MILKLHYDSCSTIKCLAVMSEFFHILTLMLWHVHFEKEYNLFQDSVQLRELWQLIQDPFNGIELQSHRHRLRTYPNCIIGSELVDWLVTNDKAKSR